MAANGQMQSLRIQDLSCNLSVQPVRECHLFPAIPAYTACEISSAYILYRLSEDVEFPLHTRGIASLQWKTCTYRYTIPGPCTAIYGCMGLSHRKCGSACGSSGREKRQRVHENHICMAPTTPAQLRTSWHSSHHGLFHSTERASIPQETSRTGFGATK
jgi:hypothetical protein